MRSSEINTLRMGQVELVKRIVLLTHTNNTMQRTVPLTRKATALFKEALANPVRPNKETDLVFFREPGKDKIRRPHNFNKAWREIKTAAGVPELHFHDLRHEAVSRFVEAGLSDQEVRGGMDWLGQDRLRETFCATRRIRGREIARRRPSRHGLQLDDRMEPHADPWRRNGLVA